MRLKNEIKIKYVCIDFEGRCTCDYGFGGSDCSFDVLSPPTITRLSGDGVCDKSLEFCDEITVYGSYFLENMKTTCYVTREEVMCVVKQFKFFIIILQKHNSVFRRSKCVNTLNSPFTFDR